MSIGSSILRSLTPVLLLVPLTPVSAQTYWGTGDYAMSGGYTFNSWDDKRSSGDYHGCEINGTDPTTGFKFYWKTSTGGDMILNMGRRAWSGYTSQARRIDALPASLVCSSNVTKSDWGLNGNYYHYVGMWSFSNPYYADSVRRDEMYICEDFANYWDSASWIGKLYQDGSWYHIYKIKVTWSTEHQWTWMAFRENRRTSGSVNVLPFLKYFRQNGLQNDYLGSLYWAVEGQGNTSGQFQYWSMSVPNIKL